jgi:hypothetical protein
MYCAAVRRIADTFSSRLNIRSQFSLLNSQSIGESCPVRASRNWRGCKSILALRELIRENGK